MIERYCPVCKQQRGFKRDIGIGTILGIIATGGLLWLFLPFYPKRCVVCGNKLPKSENNFKFNFTTILALLAFVALISIAVSIFQNPNILYSNSTSNATNVLTQKQVIDRVSSDITTIKNKKLKGYYLSQDDFKRLNEDYALVFVYKSEYPELFHNVEIYRRISFADSSEQIFLDNGISATVKAIHSNYDVLSVKLPVVNKAIAYEYANKADLLNGAKRIGFTKLIFYDNFGYYYTYRL